MDFSLLTNVDHSTGSISSDAYLVSGSPVQEAPPLEDVPPSYFNISGIGETLNRVGYELSTDVHIRYVDLVNVNVALNDFARQLVSKQTTLDADVRASIAENLWNLYD